MRSEERMAPGVPRQTLVEDSDGNHWITVEEARSTVQPATRAHHESQSGEKEKLELNSFDVWKRPVEGANDVISELAFEVLCAEERGRAGASKRLSVDFYAHQHRPLSLFEGRAGRQGLLIADEVGTGKTYSAGHILHDGLLKGRVRKALILCPARIAEKWGMTLKREFHLRCWVAKTGNQLRRWLEGDSNGFDVMVASYDKGRAKYEDEDMVDYLENAFSRGDLEELDLVIFDEVHNLIGSNSDDERIMRRRMAEVTSLLSRSRVGLTATPIWRDLGDVAELADILKPLATQSNDIDSMIGLQQKVTRASNLLRNQNLDSIGWNNVWAEVRGSIEDSNLVIAGDSAVGMSPSERIGLSERLARIGPFSTWITRTRSVDVGRLADRVVPDADLVELDSTTRNQVWDPDREQMRQLRTEAEAVEELQEMLVHLNHRLQLSSSPSAFNHFLPKLISRGYIRTGLTDRAKALALELSTRGIGSKERCLIEVLNELKERRRGAILFTHWHETFDRLTGAALGLESKIDGLKIYGADYGLSEDERMIIVNDFLGHQDPETFPLLIATDMLSESVDLQATADSVIHYDLPKNPQKVEQRIGRVDRLGQESGSVEVRYILLRDFADHQYLQAMGSRISTFEDNIGQMRPITPSGFLQSVAQGGMTDEMRERVESWNLESMAGLDLRGFKPEDLPDSLQSRDYHGFWILASTRVYASIRKALPPETEFMDSTNRVNIRPPRPANIESIIVSSKLPEGVREALRVGYREGVFGIALDSDRLPLKHNLRTAILEIASNSSPVIAEGVCITHPSMAAERVELIELVSSAGDRKFSKWLALEYQDGQVREMDTIEWQKLLSEFAEGSSLCTNQYIGTEFGGGLLEQRTEEMHASEIVWERHRLNAEARRCFAMASRCEQSDEEGSISLRQEGEALRERAEGLDYQSLDCTPPRLRLVVKGSP